MFSCGWAHHCSSISLMINQDLLLMLLGPWWCLMTVSSSAVPINSILCGIWATVKQQMKDLVPEGRYGSVTEKEQEHTRCSSFFMFLLLCGCRFWSLLWVLQPVPKLDSYVYNITYQRVYLQDMSSVPFLIIKMNGNWKSDFCHHCVNQRKAVFVIMVNLSLIHISEPTRPP